MWIYLDAECVALNITDAHKFYPKHLGEGNWALVISYKDVDGDDQEFSFACGKADQIRAASKSLLAQLKEVSGAKVTQELEDAIAKSGT